MKYRVKCRQVAVDVGQHCDAHQDPSRFRSDDSRLFILNLRRPQHPAQRLFDEPDYLLRVITADLLAFQELYENASPPSPASSASADGRKSG
jgi:hypothetical protein